MELASARLALFGIAATSLLLTTCVWPKTYTIVERFQLGDLRAETKALQGSTCVPARVSLDPATSTPLPDLGSADYDFAGDIYGLRVYVFHNDDGTYDYVEAWSAGPPPFWELVTLGWDWKSGCRIHACELPDGRRCCWQDCRDGGDRGLAYEGPDRFTCMNRSTGAIFQWFLDGLADAGVAGLDGCDG